MPGMITGLVFSVLASNAITIGLAGSALAISAISGAVMLGISVGLNYLASALFRPPQPSRRTCSSQRGNRPRRV